MFKIFTLLALIPMFLGMTVVTAAAADHAVPGSPLYSVDRKLERISLQLTSDPQKKADLIDQIAAERFLEAEFLERVFLDDDPTETPTVTPSVTPEVTETPTIEPSETPVPTVTSTPDITATPIFTTTPTIEPPHVRCTGADPHPVGNDLAQYYQIPYSQVMTWFCQGRFGFGEIMHALEASQQTGKTPEEIFALRQQKGWGQVWKELGLKGNAKKGLLATATATLFPGTITPMFTPTAMFTAEPNVNDQGGKWKSNPPGKQVDHGNSGNSKKPDKPAKPKKTYHGPQPKKHHGKP